MCGKNNTIIKFDVLHIATNVHKGHLYYTSNVTTATEVISAHLFVGKWCPTLYYVAISFHRREWYHALSPCCARIRSLGIILIPYATFVPNFVSLVTSIAELAHGENSCTQSFNCPANLLPGNRSTCT